MCGCRSAFLEAGLIDSGLQQVWSYHCYFCHDGFLQNLGHMGPHHEGADVFQLSFVLALVLGERYQSPFVEVPRDRCWVVEQAEDLRGDLLGKSV